MIDFPASPTNGQVFTSGGQSWLYDGTKWTPVGAVAAFVVPMNDNRIINGDMRIDQRNNGASGTAVSVYTVDRWKYGNAPAGKLTWQRGGPNTSVPGFPYYMLLTSASAYTSAATDSFQLYQGIEADAVSDFNWGTAQAQPVTLSFLAASSLSGLFGGAIQNWAGTRSYPFTYNLLAGVWTKFAITIPGDTAGTWVMSGNAGSMDVTFDLGNGSTLRGPPNAWASANYPGATGTVSLVATSGAYLAITGVKLEIGSVATPFNRQSLAKSMADCQRYYEVGQNYINQGNFVSGANYTCAVRFKVEKRAAPSIAFADGGSNGFPAGVPSSSSVTADGMLVNKTCNASLSNAYFQFGFTANAEL